MIPLYCFVEGDTLGLLMLAQEDQTVAELGAALQAAARVRRAPRGAATLKLGARVLDPRATILGAGLKALDRVDLREGAP
jgi:hypothetical protein